MCQHLFTIISIHVGVEIRIGEGFPIPGAECNLFERVSYQWLAEVDWLDFLIYDCNRFLGFHYALCCNVPFEIFTVLIQRLLADT